MIHWQSLIEYGLVTSTLIMAGLLALHARGRSRWSALGLIAFSLYVLCGSVASNADRDQSLAWLRYSWWLAPSAVYFWLVGSYPNYLAIWRSPSHAVVHASLIVATVSAALLGTVGNEFFAYDKIKTGGGDWSNFDLDAGGWYWFFILFSGVAMTLASYNWSHMAASGVVSRRMAAASWGLTLIVFLAGLNFLSGELVPESLLMTTVVVTLAIVSTALITSNVAESFEDFVFPSITFTVLGGITLLATVANQDFAMFVATFAGAAIAIILFMVWRSIRHNGSSHGTNVHPPRGSEIARLTRTSRSDVWRSMQSRLNLNLRRPSAA